MNTIVYKVLVREHRLICESNVGIYIFDENYRSRKLHQRNVATLLYTSNDVAKWTGRLMEAKWRMNIYIGLFEL